VIDFLKRTFGATELRRYDGDTWWIATQVG